MNTQTPSPIIAIRELAINGETAIFIGPTVLVKSKTIADAWYIVERSRCTCASFAYRGSCRHLAVAALAREADEASAQAVEPDPDPWTDGTPNANGLVWSGFKTGWVEPASLGCIP